MRELPMKAAARSTNVPYGTLQYWVRCKRVSTRKMNGLVLVRLSDIAAIKAEYVPGRVGKRKGYSVKNRSAKDGRP